MHCDIAIVGGGAAGLAAAIFAGEAAEGRGLRIVLLEGSRKPGAKILVSGGGRCNVTNERVTERDYFGGKPVLIRNVLRAFDEQRTLQWMKGLGVELKLEPTGKYFPVSDSARTVLDALMKRAEVVGAPITADARVDSITKQGDYFELRVRGWAEPVMARRVIMASGGLSLPKSGSDGWGLDAARAMGHTIVPTTPALVPMLLGADATPGGRFADFSGLTFDARLSMAQKNGRVLYETESSFLFTHFGISGPSVLDLSRHWLRDRMEHGGEELLVTLGHPELANAPDADEWLRVRTARSPKQSVANAICDLYPERFARVLAEGCGTFADLKKEQRLSLAKRLTALPLPVKGQRGYSFAETTAGGVELSEVDVRTMESKVVPGLHLCGEMLDVDGRIGGFNFQWAWASGYLAGRGAAMGQRMTAA